MEEKKIDTTKKIRISKEINGYYETFLINDIEMFLDKLNSNARISKKFKTFNLEKFSEWIESGITPMQFKKLQNLNDNCI